MTQRCNGGGDVSPDHRSCQRAHGSIDRLCAHDGRGASVVEELKSVTEARGWAKRFCFRYNSETQFPHEAPVAQLDRVLGYEPRGWEFDSLRAHHLSCRTFMRLAVFSLLSI